MYLKSLEISGFKSFAKKANLSFNTSITAIVGPNGSGKSNVAEAFRFVLGEQSIKSMRGKRGEDLIFNGSGDSSKMNRASVKVVFDNSNKFLNVDFDEVSIERVVHRDNINEYFINGSPVRLKDIVELLSGAHIGASGHHIISQGEADRILNANIKERREMVEDALGLKIYQYKKTESLRKLSKTEENMKQVESLRKEIAPHLKFLKKQVEKLEKVREMKDSLMSLYKEYFKREDIYLKNLREKISREKDGPQSELDRLEKELASARKILEESKNKDKTSEEIISIEKSLQNIRFEKEEYNRKSGRIEGEILTLEKLSLRERDKQNREDNKMIYLKDIEELCHKIDSHIKIAEKEDSFEQFKKAISHIKDLLFGFISFHHSSNQNDSKNTSQNGLNMDYEKEIASLKKNKNEISEKIAEIKEKESALMVQYNSLRENIEREKDVNRDAEREVFRIIARQNEVRNILYTIKNDEDKFNRDNDAFKQEIQEAHILAGRGATDFLDYLLKDKDGLEISKENILNESRHEQEERRKNIERIKMRIEDSGGGNGEEILKEHKEVEERDIFLERELIDLNKSAESLKVLIADLDARLDLEFKEGILKINNQFQQYFSLMFGGGTAELKLIREKRRKKSDTDLTDIDDKGGEEITEEEEEDGGEGIDINVSLPRKKVKGLMMLSGGERALTSIALIFAISQVNPPPFIILDETDAALDEANSRKYSDMIENLSKYSQLILITHNRETMSRAGILYGVTMSSDGSSKLLSIHFEDAVKVAK